MDQEDQNGYRSASPTGTTINSSIKTEPAYFPTRRTVKDRLEWALASSKRAANNRPPCAPNTPQPESLSKVTGGLSRMRVSSSLRVTIQLYILIPHRSMLPLFLFPIFCKAAEVVEREKARQVDINLIWSHELVPNGRGVNVCTWRMHGAGR